MLLTTKILKIAIFLILFTYIAALTFLYFYQHRMMFYPSRLDKDFKLKLSGQFTEGFVQLGNNISVHYLVQKVPAPQGVILYFHGNAGSLDSWGHVAYELAVKTNHEIWMMDYPGFGKSSPELVTNEKWLIKMGDQLIEKIREAYPKLPLYLYGRSIGSGIAGTLARTHVIKGLILETPYTSLAEIAADFFPWVPSRLVRFDLNNLRLTEASHPFKTLIIHGTDDEVIPYKYGQRLANRLKTQCKFVTIAGGRHNDLSESSEYWPHLIDFLKQK